MTTAPPALQPALKLHGLLFGDAEIPANIPDYIQRAALYGQDCDHPCPPDQAARWSPYDRRWITFTGLRSASIADWEPGTEVYHDPPLLKRWATVRHVARLGASIVYSDLSDVAAALAVLRGLPVRWWLATEDTGWLSAADLSSKLAADYGVTLHPDSIWGQQDIDPAARPGWDASQLFRPWRDTPRAAA